MVAAPARCLDRPFTGLKARSAGRGAARAGGPSRARQEGRPEVALEIDREIDIANIVTSAAKGVTTVQEAPTIITIITADEIKQRGYKTLVQALSTIPGWIDARAGVGRPSCRWCAARPPRAARRRLDVRSGFTEHGSSGSGLWNSSHYLVGVLSCGTGACPPSGYTLYSKFANFYSQIRPYIGSLMPSSPVANPATFVASNSFKANWKSVSGATGYRLDVATNNSFTNYVPGYQNLNVGNALSRSVPGLTASTNYYYRVRAYNGNGTSGNSNVVHVTTLSPTGPAVAITNPATLIASFSAKLNGSVNPHGLTTTVYFQYGRTTSYGSRTPNQTRNGNNDQNVFANILGLSAHTTYHFRIVATNSGGTRYGTDRTFTTQ